MNYIEEYLRSKKDREKSLKRIEKRNERVESANRKLNKYIDIITKTLYANIVLMVSILCFMTALIKGVSGDITTMLIMLILSMFVLVAIFVSSVIFYIKYKELEAKKLKINKRKKEVRLKDKFTISSANVDFFIEEINNMPDYKINQLPKELIEDILAIQKIRKQNFDRHNLAYADNLKLLENADLVTKEKIVNY